MNHLEGYSAVANGFRAWVAARDQFQSTCDGGDIGSSVESSIWVMGLEPGWSLADQVRELKGLAPSREVLNDYSVELQFEWPFNRGALKLLCVLAGEEIQQYKAFARRRRPFERGSSGYFKANLFPVPFNSLKEWGEEAARDTGFASKAKYQAWLREVRFPVVTSHIEESRPKLLIASGLGHINDFLTVAKASLPQEHSFTVNGHNKRMFIATDGLVPLVVVPHFSGGSNGLNSDEAIEIAANVILSTLPIR